MKIVLNILLVVVFAQPQTREESNEILAPAQDQGRRILFFDPISLYRQARNHLHGVGGLEGFLIITALVAHGFIADQLHAWDFGNR